MAERQNKSLNYILFFSMLSALMVMGAGCSSATPTATDNTPPTADTAQTPPSDQTPPPVAQTQPDTSSAQVTSNPTPSTKPSANAYKDGTYTVEGSYMSPGGPEQIKVQLTVQNDVVVASTVTPEAQFGKSAMLQKVFADNYKPLVIGKKLSSLSVGKVSGSSLTPLGFNDAVAKIQAEAKM